MMAAAVRRGRKRREGMALWDGGFMLTVEVQGRFGMVVVAASWKLLCDQIVELSLE